MTAKTEVHRRLILVPIDTLGVDRATLEALVMMAERLDAGLFGLFLEDDALHQAAALPFTREVLTTGAGERVMAPEELRRRTRRIAHGVQTTLTEIAAGRRIACRFEVAVGASSRAHGALKYAEHDVYLPPRTLIAARAGHDPQTVRFRRVRMLYQSGPDSARAMEILHRIARNGHTREVFILTDTELPPAVAESLKGLGLRVYLEVLEDGLERHLAGVLARPACDLLVIPRSLFGDAPESAVDLALNRATRPVLLVSARDAGG